MMSKLRTSCEMAETKIKNFVEIQTKTEYKEIEGVCKEIFDIKVARISEGNSNFKLSTVEQERNKASS